MNHNERQSTSVVRGMVSRVFGHMSSFLSRVSTLLEGEITPEELERRRSRAITAKLEHR